MIERSDCGSGGCVTCPFSFNEHSEQAQNYGCLPDKNEIIKMKESSGHNWSCHHDGDILCGGFARHLIEERPDLDIEEGGLLLYEEWYKEGETAAIINTFKRQLKELKNKYENGVD